MGPATGGQRVLDATSSPEAYRIIGALQRVHRGLGPGYLERTYHEAICIVFRDEGIPFSHEVLLPVRFEGIVLSARHRCDFMCFGRWIVEIKAQTCLTRADEAQLVHYLRSAGLEAGLLVNFGEESLVVRRITVRNAREDVRVAFLAAQHQAAKQPGRVGAPSGPSGGAGANTSSPKAESP